MAEDRHGREDSVIVSLTGAARKRWAVLAVGLALLAALFIFAGMIRTPGAKKNPYTVITSRVLAAVGAILLTRIVLLAGEDGTPVFLIECGTETAPLAGALDAVVRKYEVVPLSDVVAFIRDERYVPKKGVAVVIAVESRDELVRAVEALGAGGWAGRFPATLLLGGALVSEIAERPGIEVPAEISLAVRAAGGTDDEAIAAIESVGGLLEKATGRAAEYALLEDDDALVLGKVARATGIKAFFGGDGLNRHGDRGSSVRLSNMTDMLACAKGRSMRLSAYTTMYRGNYLPYPVWVLLQKTSARPEGRA